MKRFIYLVLCLFTCITFMTACGDDKNTETDPPVSHESQEKESENAAKDNEDTSDDKKSDTQEVEVGDASELPDTEEAVIDETDSDDESGLTIPQQNVAESPQEEFHASGTFNGFIDSSSVEITMADGSYQTFFVYDEDVSNRLMSLSDSETPPTIQFIYKAKEGQINPEIVAIN